MHGTAFLFWGSAIGVTLNVFTTWAISKHYRWGWLAALAVQPYWAAFGLASSQYSFALLAAVYLALYLQGFRTAGQAGDPMSAAGAKLAELMRAGDALADACLTGRGDLPALAEHWAKLRGEAWHEAHLVLDELHAIINRETH